MAEWQMLPNYAQIVPIVPFCAQSFPKLPKTETAFFTCLSLAIYFFTTGVYQITLSLVY
jgi:hypothetical protein